MTVETETIENVIIQHAKAKLQVCHNNRIFKCKISVLAQIFRESVVCKHRHEERQRLRCSGKPEGDVVLNLHCAASGSKPTIIKSPSSKAPIKYLSFFVQHRCCPGRPHSCFPLHTYMLQWVDTAYDSQSVLLTYEAEHWLFHYHHNHNKKVIWKSKYANDTVIRTCDVNHLPPSDHQQTVFQEELFSVL